LIDRRRIEVSGMQYGLKDKVAVVTGGSRGIGLELARALLAEGAKVALCARKRESLDQALTQLGGAGDSLLAMTAHIAKEEDVSAFIDETAKRFGRIDILINNVGMNLVTPSVADSDPSLWQKIIETNLTGTFLCSRKAAAVMKAQKKGKIVSLSSIAGRRASPAMGIYGVAKAGVEMLTKVLAAELAQFNIQVNAVAPSMVKTDFSKPFWSNAEIQKAVVSRIPLGRIADPMDVVNPVLFLSSEGADFITGQTLMVDGGSSAV
jgi:NAD(P)-dependent dehydrogenase (short-subunit alcohol dehydrogenase family)